MRPSQGHRAGTVHVSVLLAGLIAGILGTSVLGETSAAKAATATVATTTSAGEIERRLALPPFAYVAESEHDTTKLQDVSGYNGTVAFIDSLTDSLVARPTTGATPQKVAVAPDGRRFYVTDSYEPVLHVVDAETRKKILEITLPGVEPRDPATWPPIPSIHLPRAASSTG